MTVALLKMLKRMLRLLLAMGKKQGVLLGCRESRAITNCWRRSVAVVRAWYFALGKRVSIAQSP
jgi:hypothetical protein